VFNGAIPGPALYLQKGDIVKIKYVNALGPNPATQTGHNTYHNPNSTNLHTHGLHVTSESPGDNVLIKIDPGGSFDYEYKIEDDHAGGTHW
jgi:FtsP/CotA-like multicopper oxidase with cupredoxin domain